MKKNGYQMLVLFVVFCVVACSKETHDLSDRSKTIITPYMEANMVEGKNMVYCSTFQIAWNMLQDDVLKDKVLLEGRPAVADLLNKQLSTKKDVSDSSYVAMGGVLTDAFLKHLNKSLKEKFSDQAPPEVAAPDGTAILLYAFLYKNLLFNKEFERLYEPIKFYSHGTQTSIRGFGLNNPPYSKDAAELRKQVTVFEYRNNDDFIIGLSSKSADDEIILAKTAPSESLLKTITKVNERIIPSKTSLLKEKEPLHIPSIELDKHHSFNELKGKHIENEGKFQGYYISDALQWVKFRLNEKGALLKSEAMIRVAATPTTHLKRTFIFDKPFLIYLKQKNAKYPYFAMWVENPDTLVSYKTRGNLKGLIKDVIDAFRTNK
jgi:hypothetical protein